MFRRLFVISVLIGMAGLSVFLIKNEGPGLRWEPEGLYLDLNFRDLGQSLNECLVERKDKVLSEGVLLRSNKWFSGWDCANVGSPDAILSLNYQPGKDRYYYCDGSRRIIGEVPGVSRELNNIEFLTTWDDPQQKSAICQAIGTALEKVTQNKRLLFHCEAGRDRTGAFAALLGGLALENHPDVTREEAVRAIECDYTKSDSLAQVKYGRMESFLHSIWEESLSIENFLISRCGINPDLVHRFQKKMTSVNIN